MQMSERILEYLRRDHAAASALVMDGKADAGVALQDACDVVYSLFLAGLGDRITAAGAEAFADHVGGWKLAGGINAPTATTPAAVNVHLTAYVLGTLRLLKDLGHDVSARVISAGAWSLGDLVDENNRPRWPSHFSHHGWRVSHWIGGAPSIILNLWALQPDLARAHDAPPLEPVLAESDKLIAPTGVLKCYKSDLLQQVFRLLYRLRHDPEAGDVGGIVHLHWVNYASGRTPYKAAKALFDRAVKLYWRKPFIEAVPYCLDFDIVQIVRTSAQGPQALDEPIKARARQFIGDIDAFFEARLNADYAVHKLPGALATQHESAFILGDAKLEALQIAPIDIIQKAGWI